MRIDAYSSCGVTLLHRDKSQALPQDEERGVDALGCASHQHLRRYLEATARTTAIEPYRERGVCGVWVPDQSSSRGATRPVSGQTRPVEGNGTASLASEDY